MPVIAIFIGVTLILVGVGGYGYSAAGGHASPTALIPSAIGLIITICGGLATKESLRKHAMHVAVLIALLGFLGTIMGIPKFFTLLSGGAVERPAAVISQSVTALLCLLFVALGVNSFIQARRSRSV